MTSLTEPFGPWTSFTVQKEAQVVTISINLTVEDKSNIYYNTQTYGVEGIRDIES